MTHEKNFPFFGLTEKEIEESRARHGNNLLTPPQRKPWWRLFLKKFDDPVIRILIIAAALSVGVGAMEGQYLEGVGIIIAIFLATSLAFANEYRANREFDVLNKVNEETPVKIVRNGKPSAIPRKDLVVNDILLLEIGEEVPADGDVLQAISLLVDESSLTGESLSVSKIAQGDRDEEPKAETVYPADKLLRGTTVADGRAVVKISAVGDRTEIGATARAAAEETEEQTPLGRQLERLSRIIGVIAFTVAAFLYVLLVGSGAITGDLVLSVSQWYFVAVFSSTLGMFLLPLWLPILYDGMEIAGKKTLLPLWLRQGGVGVWAKSLGLGLAVFTVAAGCGVAAGIMSLAPHTWISLDVAGELMKYFMIAVTLIVVCVPEGLAMSVTLSLAYSMRKMVASNVLVRQMHACETIGAATVICTDKTGTLTLNEMRVQVANFPCMDGKSPADDPGGKMEKMVVESICANSSADLDRKAGNEIKVLGSPTEGALLLWLHDMGISYLPHRVAFQIARQWTFSTERKYMATAGSSIDAEAPVMYVKGAPEVLLDAVTSVMTAQGIETPDKHRFSIQEELKGHEKRGMRMLGFAFRKIDGSQVSPDVQSLFSDLTWLGFVAIADALRPEVSEVIATCKRAGIGVKIVTGDSPATTREIARQIGLGEESDAESRYLTGPQFGELDDQEAAHSALDLKVLARARPMDKLRLVRLLKEQGQVVAVTGDGTNDAPALNHADVGLAMGKTGTSVAREASDIIILDDAFHSIVNAVKWGRSLYQNIQKFIVFQLTINAAALGIVVLGPFIGVKMPLTIMQMLWVNLIMDTFAALALATEQAQKDVMNAPPRSSDSFIINRNMATNIFGVALFFLVFLAGLLLYIQRDLVVSAHELTFFFTIFVMLQFWNLFNVKCLGSYNSVFSNILANKAFLAIALAIICGQVIIVQYGGDFFRTVPLSLSTWIFIVAGTSAVLWAGEIFRVVKRRFPGSHK